MQDVAPLHYAENLADLEELAKPLSVGKTKNSTPWHNALKTLYKSVFDENFDQEKCYIHCLRYLVTVQRMAKLGDEKFIRAMYKSDVVKVKQKMDEVKPVLEKRYQELQNLKRKPTATCTFKSTHSINIPRRKELFVDEFITCAQLYYSIQEKKNILLIDVRSENEFKNSKIIFNNIINISGDILVPGLSANVLTSQLSDDEAKQKWENRDMYEALVFMDWNTTSENISPKLNILKSAVVDWDYLKKYKQHPVILSGGFKDFFESYPASVTNVHINYIRRNEDIDELLELDSISYPDSNVSVMNLKEFTIEKLQVSFKTDELETVEEKLDDIADIQYPDLDQNTDNKEKENIVVPKGGEYVPEPFPDSEKEKEVEEIKEFKEDPSPSQEDKEETKMRLLTEARKLKRKVLGSDNKENIEPTSPIGDILVDNRKLPPPVRRETKPQELDLKKGWCGIYNIRNICYMSTIMQCLKCIPIIKKICDPKAISLMIKRRPSVILHEFVNMIFTLWEGTETDIKVTKPYPFYNTVCKLDDTYGKGRHEDCMEFFLFLLNHLNDDCSTEIITKSGVMIEREKAWYHYLQGRSSFWVDLFYHQFKCTKVCQICSTQAVTYETDNTLMLSVPHQTKYRRIKMKQLIQEYMEDNQIMDYKCSKCQEMKVINIKSVVVAPEILVIVLKRYYQDEYRDMKKNNIPVDFEKDLLFGGANYELCSVAQHMGTIDVGHYFAAGRVPDGWVQFNDERVTRFTDMGGLAVTACAFFYTKKVRAQLKPY